MRWTAGATSVLVLSALALAFVGTAAAAPPEVTIENPDDGATVSGNVTINGTASDPDTAGTVTSVEVRIDNGTWMMANDTSGLVADWSTWSLTWNSTEVADGNHTITARATDNTGETSTDTINVTVDNAADGGGDGTDGNATPPADVNVTIEARQSGCPEGRTWCLEVTEGNLTAMDPGLRVNATFVNPAGNLGHSLYFAAHEKADEDHADTPSSAAFARIETIPGGQQASTTFTVPSNATRIYAWCDESGHEGQGMYLHEPSAGGNQTDGNGTDGNQTDGGDDGTGGEGPSPDEGQGLPGPGVAAVAAAAGVASLARRRDR